MHFLSKVKKILFPDLCIFCEDIIFEEELVCSFCENIFLIKNKNSICYICKCINKYCECKETIPMYKIFIDNDKVKGIVEKIKTSKKYNIIFSSFLKKRFKNELEYKFFSDDKIFNKIACKRLGNNKASKSCLIIFDNNKIGNFKFNKLIFLY